MERAGSCFLFSQIDDISYGCSWCSNNFRRSNSKENLAVPYLHPFLGCELRNIYYFSGDNNIARYKARRKDGLLCEQRADENRIYILLSKMVF